MRLGKMMGDGHYALLGNKSPHPNAGKAFIDYLLSEDSARILAKMGNSSTARASYPPLADADKIQFVPMDDFSIKSTPKRERVSKAVRTVMLHLDGLATKS